MAIPWRIHLAALVLIGLAGLAPAGNASAAPADPLLLVPCPRQVESRTGTARLGPDWTVSAEVPGDSVAVRLLVEESARSLGWRWRVTSPDPHGPVVEIREWSPPPAAPAILREQGYRLEIRPDRIVVAGATPVGRFYGVQTLRQLLRGSPRGEIACMRIIDWPALEWRGISDDISRGQVSTLEDFKAIIRQLSYYKLNLYQLYIEDMFLFESAPTTGAARGALSARDLRELVAEGRRFHVAVSPIFQTVAHQERFLGMEDHQRFAGADVERDGPRHGAGLWDRLVGKVHALFDALVFVGRSEGARPAAFSVGNPRTRLFVSGLVDEIARLTGPPFFHVGGDEWQPSGDDGAAFDAYGDYVARLAGGLRQQHGCRTMLYGDVMLGHPRAAAGVPRDVVVVDWQYDEESSFSSIQRLRQMGFRDVMVSPGLWTWRTFYPNYAKAFRNIRGFMDAGKAQQVGGAIGAAWGDAGAENLRGNNWTGYAFVASAAWEAAAPADSEFLRRFVVVEYGVDSEDLVLAERLIGWQEFDSPPWPGVLFHRPFPVRRRSPGAVERMQRLLADMRRAMACLDAAERQVRFHPERLPLLRHAARRYAYLAERELFLDSAGRWLAGRTMAELPPERGRRVLSRLARLEALATRLRGEYHSLWLQANRPEGLAANDERLEEQAAMIRTLRRAAIRGDLHVDDSFTDMQARDVGSARP